MEGLNVICTYWGERMKRYAAVLSASITEHCPGARQYLEEVPKPDYHRALRPEPMAHARQVQSWRDVAMSLPDGPAVFLDADMIVLRDLSCAFFSKQHKDGPVLDHKPIGVTARSAHYRYNAGALYVILNGETRRFMDDWHNDTQYALRGDVDELDRMIRDWASVDQAILAGLVLGNSAVVELPCSTFNSIDQTWIDIHEHTAVVHLKGVLRTLIDSADGHNNVIPVDAANPKLLKRLNPIIRRWQTYAGAIDAEGDAK